MCFGRSNRVRRGAAPPGVRGLPRGRNVRLQSRCAPEAPASVLPREGVEPLHSRARAHLGSKGREACETSPGHDQAARRGSHHQRSTSGAVLPAAKGLGAVRLRRRRAHRRDSGAAPLRAWAVHRDVVREQTSFSTPSSYRAATGPPPSSKAAAVRTERG